jgi:hypothetical protein
VRGLILLKQLQLMMGGMDIRGWRDGDDGGEDSGGGFELSLTCSLLGSGALTKMQLSLHLHPLSLT